MTILKFKTNINCNNCIATVTPFLNTNVNIKEWNVDISNPEKILTITGEEIKSGDIIEIIKKAGYKAEEID